MMYVKYPLSLRNVEDLLAEPGIGICNETVRLWWNRFGPMFAAEIRRKRVDRMRGHSQWRWHLDEVYVGMNGELHYLWRAVDHEGEVLESFASKHYSYWPGHEFWVLGLLAMSPLDATEQRLAHVVRAQHPGIRILMVSGFAEAEGIDHALPRLTKPFIQSDLVRHIYGAPVSRS